MNRIFLTSFFLFLLMASMLFAQTGKQYSFIVAGHTYGAHARTTPGLHPPFLAKLPKDIDSSVFALFLTGDLVNQSSKTNWNQVKVDLSTLPIPSYYIMGNHDADPLGYAAFNEKHGGTFYSFSHQNDLYIILNSTKKERSISSDQVDFLKGVIVGSVSKRVFIFIHELIWNSDAKYRGVMSNSRSRYNEMVRYSNFWSDIFPLLSAEKERSFYIMAGDVGGNTDAVSAFYDTRENVKLVASGMGEVADENYLKVHVSDDTVKFAFVPLNESITMHQVQYYSVPEKPGSIIGPTVIIPGSKAITYQASEVFNATSYRWKLPVATTGSSINSSIPIDFSANYKFDSIAVYAVNTGYGESEPLFFPVIAEGYNSAPSIGSVPSFEMSVSTINQSIRLKVQSAEQQSVILSVFDLQGRRLHTDTFNLPNGISTRMLYFNLNRGIYMLTLSNGVQHLIGRFRQQ
jgi:hypothetical protein